MNVDIRKILGLSSSKFYPAHQNFDSDSCSINLDQILMKTELMFMHCFLDKLGALCPADRVLLPELYL